MRGSVLARSMAVLALAAAATLAQAGPGQAQAREPAALQRPALGVARPAQAVLLAVTRAGRRLVAVGERGLVITSDDDGRHWSQSTVPVSVTLTGVRFATAQEGWAIGNMGVVLRTADAGATWRRVLDGRAAAEAALKAAQGAPAALGTDPAALIEDAQRLVAEGADKPWLDLALQPDGAVLAVGAYGLAFASPDGGSNWQPRMQSLPNPEGLSYYGVVQRQAETWLFGEQGLLLRAPTSSEPFAAVDSPSTGTLFGAVALREGPLLLMGLRGKVWRSAAPGAPWTEVRTPVDASLLAGLQMADGTTVLVGAAGQVLVSQDAGQSFRSAPMTVRFPFTALAETADGALLLVGMRGVQRLEAPALVRTSAETLRDARTPEAPRLSLNTNNNNSTNRRNAS